MYIYVRQECLSQIVIYLFIDTIYRGLQIIAVIS